VAVYRPSESKGRPNPIIGHTQVGILGTFPSNPEVRGVFPELSATVRVHSQEIKFYRGDAFNIDVQVQNDEDPPSGVDVGLSILRFAAKQGYGETWSGGSSLGNEAAQILKTSYDSSQIEVVVGSQGKARIRIRKQDTFNHPLVPMVWDLEVTRAVEQLDNPGTVRVFADSDVVTGTNTAWSVYPGDIIEVQDRKVLILERISGEVLRVDWTGWTSEDAAEYFLYEAISRTVAFGPWTCVGDVVQ
jgi:hypothetical protein